jgi:signal transduction histidine kinase
MVSGDRDRLAQIWINLTRNACDAAPEGAVIDWQVRVDRDHGSITLQVHNPGEPIPAELLPRLTEPFFTTKSSGTGLGLPIVRRMAEAHGGDLAIRSDATAGTRVCITLPLLEE